MALPFVSKGRHFDTQDHSKGERMKLSINNYMYLYMHTRETGRQTKRDRETDREIHVEKDIQRERER